MHHWLLAHVQAAPRWTWTGQAPVLVRPAPLGPRARERGGLPRRRACAGPGSVVRSGSPQLERRLQQTPFSAGVRIALRIVMVVCGVRRAACGVRCAVCGVWCEVSFRSAGPLLPRCPFAPCSCSLPCLSARCCISPSSSRNRMLSLRTAGSGLRAKGSGVRVRGQTPPFRVHGSQGVRSGVTRNVVRSL
eukprot:3933654-Rhodomonas_salina.2